MSPEDLARNYKNADRFAEKYDTPPPKNNRERGMLLAGVEIGRLQMRKAITHSVWVDDGDTQRCLGRMDKEGQW